MNADAWDERYRAAELVWGAGPNRWVERELAALPPGRALDLACGEGRNALWLAGLGWQVTAIDFAGAGLDKARTLASGTAANDRIEWVCADVTTYRHGTPVDLVLVCYLQLPANERAAVMHAAADALAPGGALLVVGHDSRNIEHGTGGPQDPAVLFTPQDIVDDVAGTALVIDRAVLAKRPVEGVDRPALDALVRAHQPG